jgi:hypothetical protein
LCYVGYARSLGGPWYAKVWVPCSGGTIVGYGNPHYGFGT